MIALADPLRSVEEYLAIDRAAEVKSEYHDGRLYPVCAASWIHGRLGARLAYRVGERLIGGGCTVAVSPVRVRVSPTKFVYPDIVVVCGEPLFTDEQVDTVTNPKAIIEILSPSTRDYDYGSKFTFYRELASFQEYVLVDQDIQRIEVFRRADPLWHLARYDGPGALLQLQSLNITIPLAEIYSGIIEPA
jgi:Uma2 family endonuclease